MFKFISLKKEKFSSEQLKREESGVKHCPCCPLSGSARFTDSRQRVGLEASQWDGAIFVPNLETRRMVVKQPAS